MYIMRMCISTGFTRIIIMVLHVRISYVQTCLGIWPKLWMKEIAALFFTGSSILSISDHTHRVKVLHHPMAYSTHMNNVFTYCIQM